MKKIKDLITKERSQYLIFTGLSLTVIGFTAIGYFSNNLLFQREFGTINPLIPLFFIIFLGIILLSFLLYQGGFAIYKKENLKGLFRSSCLAALFGLMAILVDLKIVYPVDNILFPESLLYYPAIGFVVEILFHVLPLSILLISFSSIFKNISYKNIIWICILIVSLLEPIFQTMVLIGSSNQYPLWVVVWGFLHVFLINLVQLFIFKRYDFISMYSFRLVYYMIWHIGWGYMRLILLF